MAVHHVGYDSAVLRVHTDPAPEIFHPLKNNLNFEVDHLLLDEFVLSSSMVRPSPSCLAPGALVSLSLLETGITSRILLSHKVSIDGGPSTIADAVLIRYLH